MKKITAYSMINMFFITSVIIILASPVYPSPKKLITVLDFTMDKTPESFPRIARNAMEVALFNKRDKLRLLERQQVKMILDEIKIKGKECKDTSCVVEVGKTLSADYAVTGYITKTDTYKIHVKLISIDSGTIVSFYSENFNSEEDIEPVINTIADRIARDIDPGSSKKKASTSDGPGLWAGLEKNISLRFNYLYAYRKHGEVFNHGIGPTLTFDIGNLFIKNFIAGLRSGVIIFTGKNDNHDHIYLFPMAIDFTYRFTIMHDLNLYPVISTGIDLIYIKTGSDTGFNMDNNSAKFSWDPFLETGFAAEYSFLNGLSLIIDLRFKVMFENGKYIYLSNYNLGARYRF